MQYIPRTTPRTHLIVDSPDRLQSTKSLLLRHRSPMSLLRPSISGALRGTWPSIVSTTITLFLLLPVRLSSNNPEIRVIALALMHKVQVGIVFERVFFLQLAGKDISLEDIHDADPCLYNSCNKILEMDAEMVDSDALGLTFVREVEELGSRKIVELCAGGKSIAVNSRNREAYVDLLIRHHFVTSISEQVAHFAKGFLICFANHCSISSFSEVWSSKILIGCCMVVKVLFQWRTGGHILNIMGTEKLIHRYSGSGRYVPA
ncbi:hypothetical protein ACSBR2_014466 [Camellia fascicularis]